MTPQDLLDAAEGLLNLSQGRPSQACLRRAQSTVYYAVFHCLAREGADLLVGGKGTARNQEAWSQIYRAFEHGHARAQCENVSAMARFPAGVRKFADDFVTLQKKRHRADYDPSARFSKTEVEADIFEVVRTISGFRAAGVAERRAFCVWALLRAARR